MEEDITCRADDSEANWDCELPATATGLTGTGLDGAPWAVEDKASALDGALPIDGRTEVGAWELAETSDCVSMIDGFSTRARANLKQAF